MPIYPREHERDDRLPTGVALPNARELLFDAADEVLRRDGVGGLTSRAVTTTAGVAKGVMHRHFADFDSFLAELALDRVRALGATAQRLRDLAGEGAVVDNLVQGLTAVFTPLATAMVALVITRPGVRARLREAGAAGLPLLAEGTAMIEAYLTAEQALGRVSATAEPAALSPTLIGAAHLLFADRESAPADAKALHKLVAAVVDGVLGDEGRPGSGRGSRNKAKH